MVNKLLELAKDNIKKELTFEVAHETIQEIIILYCTDYIADVITGYIITLEGLDYKIRVNYTWDTIIVSPY